ncbi:MAG TPA: PEP-CTERM sorting domain-containing protein [Bryobacteraceae bacterium]|nr:PEP-CTERM sorting domain-containing protein [Bryobacteraceae bacterium]
MKTLFLILAASVAVPVFAAPINVALGKPVTLNGFFGNSTAGTPIVWPDFAIGPASLVTDGVFNPDQQHWQTNSVWWHEHDTLPPRSIEIDLLGTYTLIGAIVQADNNEQYLLEYKDAADVWQTLWNVPVGCCFGVVTRPNPLDNTEIQALGPVVAKALRISGVDSDLYYSVTEVQVFAEQVPEPSTWVLAGAGLGALLLRRRR